MACVAFIMVVITTASTSMAASSEPQCGGTTDVIIRTPVTIAAYTTCVYTSCALQMTTGGMIAMESNASLLLVSTSLSCDPVCHIESSLSLPSSSVLASPRINNRAVIRMSNDSQLIARIPNSFNYSGVIQLFAPSLIMLGPSSVWRVTSHFFYSLSFSHQC